MTTWLCFKSSPPLQPNQYKFGRGTITTTLLTMSRSTSIQIPPTTVEPLVVLIPKLMRKNIKQRNLIVESSQSVMDNKSLILYSESATQNDHVDLKTHAYRGFKRVCAVLYSNNGKEKYDKNMISTIGAKRNKAFKSSKHIVKREGDKSLTNTIGAKKDTTFKTSRHLLAGILSAIISRTLIAPLERLKLEYIVHGNTKSMIITIQNIFLAEGYRGFWKGNMINLLRTAPYKSVNFFAYDIYHKQWLVMRGNKELTNFQRLIVGAAAGVTATLICFPLDTIRIKLLAPGGEALQGIIGCITLMVRKEGIASFYRGLMPAVISVAPSGAIFHGVFGLLKYSYLASSKGQKEYRERVPIEKDSMFVKNFELGPFRTLLYGAIAGVCAETSTYPFEVVRRHLQLQTIAAQLSLIEIIRTLVHRGGIKALYVGILPSTFQVLPSAALSYFLYEVLKRLLKVE